ncbi:hypothetical protein H0H92_003729 [Tricholoma furcatifolium]|nr:hypothetical protein H0H92_003729 [Tricholoma furcatifolium]
MSQTIDPNTYEGIDMSAVFSPFYWGTVVSLILSGITFLQAYTYFPGTDRLPIRLLVGAAVMISLDIASTGLVSQGFYYYVAFLSTISMTRFDVIQFPDLFRMANIHCGMGKSKSNVVIPVIVMVFAITSFGPELNSKLDHLSRYSPILTRARRTDTLLKTLIQFIVQRGVLVTMIQTLFLVIFFSTASHAWWLALHVNVTRLYANTFFAMLNGRQSLRNKRNSTNVMSASELSGGTYQGGSYGYPPSGVKFPSTSDTTHIMEKGINVDKTVIISDM